MRKLLLAIIALALVAGIVWFLLHVDGGDEATTGSEEGARALAGSPGDAADRHGGPRPGSDDDAAKSGRGIRRFESKGERERLVAMIAAAAKARREAERARAEAEDEADRDAGAFDGTLTKESIQEGVRAVIEDVKRCYEDALKKTPDLEGKLVVDFEIVGEPDAGGVVDEVEIADSSDDVMRQNSDLTECMMDAIYSIELPPPDSGGRVKVSYPFTMRPD